MAIAAYIQIGDNVDYTPEKDVAYREVVAFGSRIAVSNQEIAKGETGSVCLTGVYQLPAEAGAAIAVGAEVFYDTKKEAVVAASGTDTVNAGIAVAAKTEAGTTCLVRIG